VLVRHNTTLLEQAIDLQVKQSAIPTLQAEAAAHDKIARANAFRRMMTGAAIAVAAIGIGIGASLLWPQIPKQPPITETANPDKRIDRLPPDETISKEGKTTRPKSPDKTASEEPVDKPVQPLPLPQPEKQEDKVTEDFNKFLTREIDWGGTHWALMSGHHFVDEHDATWDRAWCYTRRLVNGVDVNIDLVNRASPTAKPQAPTAPPTTLASIGLNEASALELASKCAWLDGSTFTAADYEAPAGRPSNELVMNDGWDAVGNDLPGMPIRDIPFSQCEAQCNGDSRCVALTYDKRHSACFMKSDASVLIRDENATMAARGVANDHLQYSTLVFAANTVVVGNSYSSVRSGYAECVVACAMDQRCVAFNFDTPNKMCSMLDRATSSQTFKTVASGLKANNI
jgi:hypothetical protein